jgi:hypothetical protein
VRVNSKKINIVVPVHVYLKIETATFKTRIWTQKQQGTNYYQNASAWNIRKGNQISEVPETISGLQ